MVERAGRAVTAAASDFTACVTTDGLLGSFLGVVDGSQVDISLTQYGGRVSADAFDLPEGARIADERAP